MKVRQNLVSESRWPIKCPYSMVPEFYVVHNTANDASAANEIAYMIRNDNQVSYHYAIDDIEIVQGIPENRNGWHAGDGNGPGNRKGIGIEICYSKSGGPRFIAAEKLAARFIGQGLTKRGWGIGQVKKHQDFSGKYCPHRTLDMGWQRFLDMVKAEMKGNEKKGGGRGPMNFVLINTDDDYVAAKRVLRTLPGHGSIVLRESPKILKETQEQDRLIVMGGNVDGIDTGKAKVDLWSGETWWKTMQNAGRKIGAL